jgi:azurin
MRFFAAFTLVLAATLAGSSAVSRAADPPRTIDIIGTDDMKYSIVTITAKPGEQLRVRLMAKGKIPKVAMAHNFVLLKLGTDLLKFVNEGAPHRMTDFIAPNMTGTIIAKTGMAGPGESVQVTFKAPEKPGKYPYLCTFPGHFQAGMKGTLIVK